MGDRETERQRDRGRETGRQREVKGETHAHTHTQRTGNTKDMSEVDWGKHIRKSKATVHTGKPARRTRAHTRTYRQR